MRTVAGVVALGFLLLGGSAGDGLAQTAQPVADVSTGSQPLVSFQFDRVVLDVPHFLLRVREDGTGSYQADQAARSSTDQVTLGTTVTSVSREIPSPLLANLILGRPADTWTPRG